MQNEQKKTNTMTAAQRLEGLENAMMTMDRAIGDIMQQVRNAAQAIRLLGDKVDAIVQASATGRPISDETLNQIMTDGHVEELKAKAQALKDSGYLQDAEVVGENSFIVFREMNTKTGELVSARTQLTLKSMEESWKALFVGKKAGDLVSKEGGDYSVEISEIYDIVTPAQEAQAEQTN